MQVEYFGTVPAARVYTIKRGNRFDALRFEDVDRWGREVAQWMGRPIEPLEPGSDEHFRQYDTVMREGKAFAERSGRICKAFLYPPLVGCEGRMIQVRDSSGITRSFTVGVTGSWLQTHVEVYPSKTIPLNGLPFTDITLL